MDAAAVPFLAMPVLRGMTLADALRANPRPPLAETVRIAREAAEGLAAAHATGLVHRDIKPGNIWLEEGRLRVKVLDFGLARRNDEFGTMNDESKPGAAGRAGLDSSIIDHQSSLTAAGSILGTPAYMSPEQALGRPLDHRTDLFSLGVVLYQMATGRAPFPGATALAVMTAVVRVEPTPAGELAPDLPPPLADLIGRLLAKNPTARPPSAAAVAAELGAVEKTLTGVPEVAAGLWGEIGDDAPTLTEALAPVRRRGRRWVPAALAGVGLVLIAGTVAGVLYVRAATDAAVLEIDDAGAADVALTVSRDGRPVAERTRDRRLTLPSGRYTVELSDPDPAVKLSAATVTLDRGGRETLTLRVNKQLVVARKLDDGYLPDDPEWLKLFLRQPPKAQVNRFVKELQRLNPDFDGKVEFKDDGGKVVHLSLKTDAVSDLSPVRALRELKELFAEGRESGSGRLADLAPLRGLRLTKLSLAFNPPCRNADALRGMPLQDVYYITIPRGEDVRVFHGTSLNSLSVFCPERIDFADVRPCLSERAFVQSPQFRNLAALGAHPLHILHGPADFFDDPAAAEVRVENVNSYSYPEALAERGRFLRRNPHVKTVMLSPRDVFWAFFDLAPRPLAPAWRVLGPCRPAEDDPFDPAAAGGRLAPEFLAAPVPRRAGPPLRWADAGLDANRRVDYGAVTGRDESAAAWLHAVVRADEPGRAVLFVEGAPHYRVWWNGESALSKPENGWSAARQAVLVTLRAGENPVTVRAGLSPKLDATPLGFHLHRLRPGEAPPAGIDPPLPPSKE